MGRLLTVLCLLLLSFLLNVVAAKDAIECTYVKTCAQCGVFGFCTEDNSFDL
jgi:hypothetical protein